jgi:SAM-dependent methyltransferase
MLHQFRLLSRRYLSRETRRWLARLVVWPPVGWIHFGQLRRLQPITRNYGNSRGMEIDRYYIEKFLSEHVTDIHGHVLEIKHNTYTVKYGGNRVTKSDVLHKVAGNPDATIIADLSNAVHLPSNTFDTIIFTQTLQFIYDIRSTITTLHRILRPGGILLATASGMAQISQEDFEQWGEYWRFTSLSARLLFEEVFSKEDISIYSYGNVLAAISFLEGLAVEDLRKKELEATDPNYELIIAIRAVKAEQPS